MPDILGFRQKIGILIPCTNSSVQPELDDLRPRGVTNHIERIQVSNVVFREHKDAQQIAQEGLAGLDGALERLLPCRPDRIIMAMAAPCFWGGTQGCALARRKIEQLTELPFVLPPESLIEALRNWPGLRRIGVITPYIPAADEHVQSYFEAHGYETEVIGLRAGTEDSVIDITPEQLRTGFAELQRRDVDAYLHVGTSIAVARLVEPLEFWLQKPVLSVNIATYWHSLRNADIRDQRDGFGRLMRDF